MSDGSPDSMRGPITEVAGRQVGLPDPQSRPSSVLNGPSTFTFELTVNYLLEIDNITSSESNQLIAARVTFGHSSKDI